MWGGVHEEHKTSLDRARPIGFRDDVPCNISQGRDESQWYQCAHVYRWYGYTPNFSTEEDSAL